MNKNLFTTKAKLKHTGTIQFYVPVGNFITDHNLELLLEELENMFIEKNWL